MIHIKTPEELAKMREAGRIVALAHDAVRTSIRAGMTSRELNAICERVITEAGATPSFKGLYGFPAAACISINDLLVHGIPDDTVLKEAKSMGIPVIMADRMAEVEEELFTSWVGSDFRLQGEKACAWLDAYLEKEGRDTEEVNIVDMQGTLGASAQTGRSEALVEAAGQNGWTIIAAQSGEYTKAKAWEVMSGILDAGTPVDVVYCENDNMAFGVIEAIEENGRTAGKEDIIVISFDATREGLSLVRQGKILLNVECNPMLGPETGEIIRQLERGEEPEKYIVVSEELYASDEIVEEVAVGANRYPVETVTEETVNERNY